MILKRTGTFFVFVVFLSWFFWGRSYVFNFPNIQTAYADSTGALAAGANAAKTSSAGDNDGFETTPGSADDSDNNAYAVSANTGTGNATDGCSTFNQSEDDAHDYYNFGIAPAAGSTIDGIQVNTTAKWSTNTGTNQLCVELSWDGGTSWTSTANTTGDVQTSESADTLGGSANTWGRTWTVSELNNTNFRVRVMIDPGGANTTTASLELLTVTVTYTLPPTFTQAAYRFFDNSNSLDVGTALALQDTAATLGTSGDAFRLRALIHVGDGQLGASGQNFKLQFAEKSGTCDTSFSGESYADVTGSTVIAYNNNATPADGDNLTANASDPTHSGHTIVNQDYEEANNFTNTVAAIPAGQDGKWDFALIDNGATADTSYCFRIVKSDGTQLDTYSVVPEIITATEEPIGTLTFSISDNSIGFGTLSASAARYATSDVSGSSTEVEAHTITASTNASSGYVITLNGGTLTSGANTITAIGSSNTASSAGSEQFGLRMSASGGNGAVTSPYAASGFAFDTGSLPDQVASDADGDDVSTTYSVRYLGNISGTTEAGSYSATLTYIITAGF